MTRLFYLVGALAPMGSGILLRPSASEAVKDKADSGNQLLKKFV